MDIDKLIAMGEAGNLDGLEAERERMFQELLSTLSCPKQRLKAEQLQFKSKNLHVRSKSLTCNMVKASKLMIDSLGELNKEMDKLRKIL